MVEEMKDKINLDKMISLLAHNRRVFIDVRNRQNNEPLISSITDEQERETFALGLTNILDHYPHAIHENIAQTKEVLKQFAYLCGITFPTQPGWFCPVEGSAVKLMSLTLSDYNNQWYTFMASDYYMSVEKCEHTKKHIIRLQGGKETGKTPTMKIVFEKLQHKYSEHSAVLESTASYDVKGVFFIGNAKVGIDGQGDPNGRQLDSIEEFVSIGCDIILVSSRTFGMTVDAVDRFKGVYLIDEESRDIRYNPNEHEIANTAQADKLVSMVEQFAAQI